MGIVKAPFTLFTLILSELRIVFVDGFVDKAFSFFLEVVVMHLPDDALTQRVADVLHDAAFGIDNALNAEGADSLGTLGYEITFL